MNKETYLKWLRAAYIYYYGYGEDTGMSDQEWDCIGRQINPNDWDELKDTGYVPGQSLYWLPKDKYPLEVRN